MDKRDLVGYSPWGHKESDATEHAHTHLCLKQVIPTIADAVTASGFQQTVLWPASCFLHLSVPEQVLWPQHVLRSCNEARCAGESHPLEQSSANEGKELSIKAPYFFFSTGWFWGVCTVSLESQRDCVPFPLTVTLMWKHLLLALLLSWFTYHSSRKHPLINCLHPNPCLRVYLGET